MASSLPRLAPPAFAVLQIITPLTPWLGLGVPIGERSDAVRTLLTPAGWAFSIWGPLYAGGMLFALYQALPAQRDNALVQAVRWPAAGAFLGNAVWAAYTQLDGLSAVSSFIILATLAPLLVIVRRLAGRREQRTAGERWCMFLPLSALAGWLTAATIANLAASLRFHGIAVSPSLAAAMLIAGAAVAATVLVRARGNPPYGLVFLWALAAIGAAGGLAEMMVAAAVALAALLTLAAMAMGLRTKLAS